MSRENELNVRKIMAQLQEQQSTASKRKGSFKIDATFDEAMKKIVKAKPEKAHRRRKGQDGKTR